MKLLQVFQMLFGLFGRVAAVLAHIQLGSSLFVLEAQLHLMYLVQMRLETAALSELALAFETLERTHPGVSACVTLEIERVIEALLTECAQVALYIAMVFHVTIHQSLQFERLLAYLAFKLVLRVVGYLDSREEIQIVV